MKNSFQRLLSGESLSFGAWFILVVGILIIAFPYLFTIHHAVTRGEKLKRASKSEI